MYMIPHTSLCVGLLSQRYYYDFFAYFVGEILAYRLPGGGVQTFRSCWFLLDFFLVCVGMLALVVAPMFTGCWLFEDFEDCAQKMHDTHTDGI